jgi:hypothetical protein
VISRIARLALGFLALLVHCQACSRGPSPKIEPAPAAVVAPDKLDIAESVYDGGLKNGWQDMGWTPHDLTIGAPAKVRFSNNGAWMIGKPGLSGDFGGVVFIVKTPPGEAEFLELRLESDAQKVFPRIKISPDHRTDLGNGWTQIFVATSELNPDGVPFDRIVFRAFRSIGNDWVFLDKIALIKGSGAVRSAASYDVSTLPQASLAVDCSAKSIKISPYIYGIAYYPFEDKNQSSQWLFGATVRRWGGNPTSVYNWELDVWNTGKDWFFENGPAGSYAKFFEDNQSHQVESTLTVPILGWVAKDKTSYSFPVSAVGPQEAVDPYKNDAGNGMRKGGGAPIPSTPSRAYVQITPAFVKRWVESIRKEDQRKGRRTVYSYILDNEPGIWHSTHRDSHPEPLTYDELVQRSIDYGTAVRQADPDAIIAGPAEWGWSAYLYSAKDLASGGTTLRPDRRAHGDLPIVAYYLKALADYEKKTGVRVLDVFDLHAYPYADRVGGDAADDNADVAALRIRSTRMLWDPTYVDESWVHDAVNLLPRMRAWIDENYPGRGISLGEWNYGGEMHMSGALATAEALGRYAQFGVTSAYYWSSPPENSPTMWGFRAYRNFDGKGGRFLDWFTPASRATNASIFASRDETGKHMVVIALNFSRKDAIGAKIDLSSCGKVRSANSYSYAGGAKGFVAGAQAPLQGRTAIAALPPYSITVLDLQLDDAVPPNK